MPVLSKLSDNELYALLKQDNEQAFEILYDRYWKPMIHRALCKLEDSVEAEIVVQDTFVDIWKSRKRIEIKHTFHTYIAAIVRYKVLSVRAQKERIVYKSVADLSDFKIIDDSTQQQLNLLDLQEEIESAVKTLPPKCQLIFRMSREEGKKDHEIASELLLSQKTVEAHLLKALKSIRLLLHKTKYLLILQFILQHMKK